MLWRVYDKDGDVEAVVRARNEKSAKFKFRQHAKKEGELAEWELNADRIPEDQEILMVSYPNQGT